VLPGKLGAADIFVRSAGLLIAVEGEQHIDEGCTSVSLAEQQARDARVDAGALSASVRLLCIHYRGVE
jgi:hypothetical protein